MPVTQPFWTSSSDEWATPQAVVDAAARALGVEAFALDAAATAENAKAPEFYSRENSALLEPWEDATWCNPPYSVVAHFAKHAALQAREGVRVALLVPARVDTRWWHQHVMPHATALYLLIGRLQFIAADKPVANAPFPSVIAMLGPSADGAPRCHSLKVD